MSDFWAGRRVLVTGHTGFKGSWLSLWLLSRGAQVFGLALEPDTTPSLFDQLALAKDIDHKIGDIRDFKTVRDRLHDTKPGVVFHLAAQPLVRRSYREPLQTWQTNVMGTMHVLEAMRALENPCAGIMITTDKVYDNREWVHAYRENDALGGHDPYSSSKAGAEIGIASWRASFFPEHQPVAIASARAGNVIGGGDWAEDRIVPDCMRALGNGQPLTVRNPLARRPWQHVLDPLSGYLTLAEQLCQAMQASNHVRLNHISSAFNFGPLTASNRTVSDLVSEIFRAWPGALADAVQGAQPHEARELNLATEKAFHRLGWQSRWNFARTIGETVNWYKSVHDKAGSTDIRALCMAQIKAYSATAA